MPFHSKDSIRYYSFGLLEQTGITHAVFTRNGGVSPNPWDTLNVGGTVGDNPARVAHNRSKAFEAVGRSPGSMFDVWQVHGNEVVLARNPRRDASYQKADILLTDRPNVTLFMRFADCVPVMLYDPIHQAVGIVHAGWQGTVRKAVVSAVEAMVVNYDADPNELLAGIGPSIGPHHYEVGPEVAAHVMEAFGEVGKNLLLTENGSNQTTHMGHNHDGGVGDHGNYRVKFDLWAANRLLLEQAGVRMIEVSGICTACHLEDWFSHRGEKGRTGRFGALITNEI